jgi:hypothetical protein
MLTEYLLHRAGDDAHRLEAAKARIYRMICAS